jgi:NitT/TauT family transport system substrate-binding protein
MMHSTTNTRRARRLLRGAWALAGMMALALPDVAQATDHIKFIADWTAEAEHGCFYQAKADGTYEKAGLDVSVQPGGPSVNGPQLLASGAVDFAIISSGIQAVGMTKNKIPITIIAALMQRNEQILMAHKSQGMHSLAEMKGKPIMISSFSVQAYWPWLKAEFGFTDDQIRPYNFNLAPFLQDQTTIQQGYLTSEPFAAKKGGADPAVFLLADYGYVDTGSLIGVRTDWIKSKPDLIQRFIDATLKGCYAFLDGDPSKAFALIKKDNPDMGEDQMKYTWDELKRNEIFTSGDAKTLGIGAMTDARWKAIWDQMVKDKISEPGEDYKAAYDTQFVDKKVGMPPAQ